MGEWRGGDGASETVRGRSSARWVAVALVLLVGAVFAPAARFEFLNLDDDLYVTANPYVQAGLTAESVRWAFTAFHSGHWHPLTWLSLMLDATVFGIRPGPTHAENVAWHALGTALLFLVLRAATGATGRSAFVAAVYGLHPLRVESVAWVTERKDVLSAFFWILTLGAYVRYARRPSVARYSVVVTTFVLGILAKPMLVTLPVVLLLLDYWPLVRMRWSSGARAASDGETPFARARVATLVAEKVPLLVLAAVASSVTSAAQQAAGAIVSLDVLPLGTRVANAAWGYAAYLGKTIWPVELAVFYPLASVPPLSAMLAGAGVVAATFAAIAACRRAPYLTVGWLWWVGTLVPVIGLVQIGGQAYADRFTYVPHIGLFLALAWGAHDLAAARRADARLAAVAAGCVVAVIAGVTSWQLGYWRDSVTVFRRALAVTNGNYMAHNNLGVALAAAGHSEEAARHYAEAVRLNPTWPEARSNLGMAYAAAGDYAGAREQFAAALRVRPDFPVALNNLATAYAYEGDFERAIDPYARAVALAPAYFAARLGLADALERSGRLSESEAEYRRLVEAQPQWVDGVRRLARVRTALAAR